MLFFLRGKEDSVVYLLKDESTVGRKDADVIIANDQSISRKHSILKKEKGKIVLMDCESKYNTYVNNCKIEPNRNIDLRIGDNIKFGAFESIYELHCVKIKTTTSGLNNEEKKKVVENLKFLSGQFVSNWMPDCTHLTVSDLKLTVKVLCALIQGIPIVTVKFWDSFVKSVKKNLPSPEPIAFKPSCGEILLNKDLCLDYREERKNLFSGKIFVFPTESEKKCLEMVIKCAGGNCTSFESQPITKDDLQNPDKKYLLMQNTDSPTKGLSNDFKELLDHLKVIKKRPIPFTEVALSIVNCSCQKDCNPDFDRGATVLGSIPKSSQPVQEIVVIETQTQNVEMPSNYTQNVTTIPPTLECPILNTENCEKTGNSMVVDTQSQSKRIAEESIEVIDDVCTKKGKTLKTLDNFVTKSNNKENSKQCKLLDSFSSDKKYPNPFASSQKNKDLQESTKKRKFNFVEVQEKSDQRPQKQNKTTFSESEIKIEDSQPTKQNWNQTLDSKITPDTESVVNNTWLSRDNISLNITKKIETDDIDEEVQQFVESFKNSVIIVEKNLISLRTTIASNKSVWEGKNNFKKFKKVYPTRGQTFIIPKSELIRIVCNNVVNSKDQDESCEEDISEDEVVVIEPRKTQNNSKKKSFRFFKK